MVNNIIDKIQINRYQMSRNNHHTYHRPFLIVSNHHHQQTNLQGFPDTKGEGRGQKLGGDLLLLLRYPLLQGFASNWSEYEHLDILISIIFDCRNSNANDKDADDNHRRRCLQAWLIFAGTLYTFISLAAMIISIYLLIIMSNTSTTTKGKNKVLFLKLRVHMYICVSHYIP
jgi:hypothetical protein